MLTNEMSNSLQSAYQELLNAENELSRPREDVVTLSACHSIRESMRLMMQIYLNVCEVPTKENSSLIELLENCKKINPKFATVDMSHVECNGIDHINCDDKYCLSMENVSNCMEAANQVNNIVRSAFKLS